jgi:hypothetical protein
MLTIAAHINSNIVVDDIQTLQQKLQDTLTGLLDRYGINDTLKVDVNNKSKSDDIAFIRINNYEQLIVPYYLANALWHFARNNHVQKKASETAVLSELVYHKKAKEINQFLHDYIIENIKCNINLLISDEFIDNLLADTFEASNSFLKPALKDLINEVLKYHISIHHFRKKISRLNTTNVIPLSEELIAEFRSKEVKIICSSDYLLKLITKFNDSDSEVFKTVDEVMFYEFGIDFPDVKFITGNLPYGYFKIRVNDFESCLFKGLDPDEVVIQKTYAFTISPQDNKENILHPANDSECIVVTASSVSSREFQVWPPFAFTALHLVDIYRKNTNWFFDSKMCKNIIDDLGSSQPALIECLHSKVDDHFICRVLRLLLEEKISLRNIESIFQSIIDFDYIVADGVNNIVFDSRLTTLKEPDDEWLHDPGNIADFVRLNLKQYISSILTNSSYSLHAYLLDKQMEDRILKMDNIVYKDPAFYDLINSVEKVIEENKNNIYPVLSTVEVRRKFRQIVKKRFPELAVICYQELSPSTNITPVARISFNSISVASLSTS